MILNAIPQEDLVVHLYTNDRDPDAYREDEVREYVEMDGMGYRPMDRGRCPASCTQRVW